MIGPLQLACYTDNPMGMLECGLADLAGAVGGQAMFALLAGGTIIFGYYKASGGSLATPSVMLLLLGGLMIPSLPAQFATMAQVLMFLGLVGAVLAGLKKYVGNSI